MADRARVEHQQPPGLRGDAVPGDVLAEGLEGGADRLVDVVGRNGDGQRLLGAGRPDGTRGGAVGETAGPGVGDDVDEARSSVPSDSGIDHRADRCDPQLSWVDMSPE